MSINNVPEIGPYTELKPFRFWCQKVLPLTYDESLSYYELLCKVVDYLNKAMEDVDQMADDMGEFKTAYEELINYVNNYFDNLDVQEEINNKLDSMAEDGTLATIVAPFFAEAINEIPGVVSDWLAAHVDPDTGYVIDDTLTITDAAADAKAVGDILKYTPSYKLSHNTDLNTLVTVGLYSSASGSTNQPAGESANFYLVLVLPDTSNPNRVTQFFIGLLNNNVWVRQRDTSNVWGSWQKLQDGANAYVLRTIANNSDLNNITDTGFYIGAGAANVTNAPEGYNTNVAFLLQVYKDTNNANRVYQSLYTNSDGNRYGREKTSAGPWTPWVLEHEGMVFIQPINTTSWRVYFGKYNTRLYHTVDNSINADLWNLLSVQYGSNALCSVSTDMLGPVREKGQSDFMGGVHGDEIVDEVIITADGKPADLSANTYCKELKVSFESTLYRPSDHTTAVMKRLLTFTVSYNKIEVCSTLRSLVNGLVIDRCTNGGLLAMGNTWLTKIFMGSKIYTTPPTVNVANEDKGTVEAVLYWSGGLFRMENIIGHENPNYKAMLITYENETPIRNKIYFNTIESSAGVTLNTGDEIVGKCRYTFE